MEDATKLIVDYLTSVPAWYLATAEVAAGGAVQPHVRPFSFAMEQDGRIQFCTATTKDVYREMAANPQVELTAWKPGSGWIIMRGNATFPAQQSKQVRHDARVHLESLGESYEGDDDPQLVLFTLDNPQAWLCEIDGSWNPLTL